MIDKDEMSIPLVTTSDNKLLPELNDKIVSENKYDLQVKLQKLTYDKKRASELQPSMNDLMTATPVQLNEEIIVLHIEVLINNETLCTWDKAVHFQNIKDAFSYLKDETKSKGLHPLITFHNNSSLQGIFAEVDRYSLHDIDIHLKDIISYLKSLLSYFLEVKNKSKIPFNFLSFFGIGFNSFTENSKTKPLQGFILKQSQPKRCLSVQNCLFSCIYSNIYNKRWFTLYEDKILYSNTSEKLFGKNVFWFSEITRVNKVGENKLIFIDGNGKLCLKFPSLFDRDLWFNKISKQVKDYIDNYKAQTYQSYCLETDGNTADYFCDGKNYFSDLYDKLMQAKKRVLITDWWLSPEVFLKRPVNHEEYEKLHENKQNVKNEEPFSRLMDVLNYLAHKGVKIYILIYCECPFALTLNSYHTKHTLTSLHPNIEVIRDPTDPTWLWSHHEKLVVIDEEIGYVGGLDLCWGRYDTNDHPIYEKEADEYDYPFIDYSNARIIDFMNVDNYLEESVKRKNFVPRMPWHDVHIRLQGPIVADIAKHFVQRWNFHKEYSTTGLDVSNSHDRMDVEKKKKIQLKKGGFFSKIIEQVSQMDELNDETQDKEGVNTNNDGLIQLNDVNEDEKNKKEEENVIETKKDDVIDTNIKENENKNDKFLKTELVTRTNLKDEEIIGCKKFNRTKTFIEFQSQVEKKGFSVKDPNHIICENAYDKFVSNLAKSRVPRQLWFNVDSNDNDRKTNDTIDFSFTSVVSKLIGAKAKCQALRSACNWSVGTNEDQQFILKAYYQLIQRAKHYIFIENQFFVSRAWTEEERKEKNFSDLVQNEIALYIRKRIELAFQRREKFKVYIFIPLLPGFAGDPQNSGTLRFILQNTYNSISRGGLSIIEHLSKIMTMKQIEEYIGFYSLRGHALINNVPVTEIIYIHSKLMIIDDETVLIGSANINDRSMLGSRDSEFAVVVKEERSYRGVMNGKSNPCAKFAFKFRKALMKEHLGIKDNEEDILNDPISDELWELTNNRAAKNTKLYSDVFGCYPDDKYKNMKDLSKFKVATTPEEKIKLREKYESERFATEVVGHIVKFPLYFLKEEVLGIKFFTAESVIPPYSYT